MKPTIDARSRNRGFVHPADPGSSESKSTPSGFIQAIASALVAFGRRQRPTAPRPWLVFAPRLPYPDHMTARSNPLAHPLRSGPPGVLGEVPKEHAALLADLAAKYLWWLTPVEATAMPARVVAQVMHLGDYADVQRLAQAVGDDYLKAVLVHADAGLFDDRSWAYWHYRLGLAEPEQVPPLPKRKFA